MPVKSHHVVHNPNGGWDVKKGGASRVSAHFDTKKEAEAGGRIISQNQNSELFIHRLDGTFERRDSHGRDPYPPRDKNTH